MKTLQKTARLIFLSLLILMGCQKNNPVTDAEKLAALRNVTLTYDSTTFVFGLPSGALSGKSFQELVKADSATYTNPANYSISIHSNVTAHNTKTNAEDAQFDGMILKIVMDTIVSSPVNAVANSFEVKKDSSAKVQANETINLKTHRKAGLYIFRQMVSGNDIATTQTPGLNYKIGALAGTIDLPSIQENIPTRASAETKAFLKGLLDSGIFNQ